MRRRPRRLRFSGPSSFYHIWKLLFRSQDPRPMPVSLRRLLEKLRGPAGAGWPGMAKGGEGGCCLPAGDRATCCPACPCSPVVPPSRGGISRRPGCRVRRNGWGVCARGGRQEGGHPAGRPCSPGSADLLPRLNLLPVGLKRAARDISDTRSLGKREWLGGMCTRGAAGGGYHPAASLPGCLLHRSRSAL